MDSFKPGDIAVIVSAHPFYHHLIGCDVEITSHAMHDTPYGIAYDGNVSGPKPHPEYYEHLALRKKKPPKESKDIQETREKGAPSWDEMMDGLKAGEPVI